MSSLPGEEMYYRAEYVDHVASGGNPFTRIYLYNTPLIAPLDVNNRGLANSFQARLYQMEYVPSPVDAGPAFTTDLTDARPGYEEHRAVDSRDRPRGVDEQCVRRRFGNGL